MIEKFVSGWRYITTPEEADALPTETIAIEDDPYIWRYEYPIIGCSQRVDYGSCDDPEKELAWVECDDHVRRPMPNLPFFAWHPSFCNL